MKTTDLKNHGTTPNLLPGFAKTISIDNSKIMRLALIGLFFICSFFLARNSFSLSDECKSRMNEIREIQTKMRSTKSMEERRNYSGKIRDLRNGMKSEGCFGGPTSGGKTSRPSVGNRPQTPKPGLNSNPRLQIQKAGNSTSGPSRSRRGQVPSRNTQGNKVGGSVDSKKPENSQVKRKPITRRNTTVRKQKTTDQIVKDVGDNSTRKKPLNVKKIKNNPNLGEIDSPKNKKPPVNVKPTVNQPIKKRPISRRPTLPKGDAPVSGVVSGRPVDTGSNKPDTNIRPGSSTANKPTTSRPTTSRPTTGTPTTSRPTTGTPTTSRPTTGTPTTSMPTTGTPTTSRPTTGTPTTSRPTTATPTSPTSMPTAQPATNMMR